jgi:hypothetical protein
MPNSNLTPLIDEYGLIKAQIAELQLKLDPIHEQLVAMGDGAYEGLFYRVAVSSFMQSRLDTKACKKKLSRQFIKANTKTTPVTKVTVSGRTAQDVKNDAVKLTALANFIENAA